MRLNHTQGQFFFSKQSYSQLQGSGRRNTASGTPFHAYTQTRIRTQYTDRSKKVIFATIYPNEMATVLAMYIITSRVNIPPPFFLFQLAKAPEASPLRAARSLLSLPDSMWHGDS